MDEFAEMAGREREAKRIAKRQWFWLHAAVFVTTQLFPVVIWALRTSRTRGSSSRCSAAGSSSPRMPSTPS
jgi:hypothetical protein